MKRLHALEPIPDERYPLSEAIQALSKSALQVDEALPKIERELEWHRQQLLALQQSPTRRPLLTKQETADYLNISISLLSDLMARGEIPYIRLNGETGYPRFRADDLDQWIESRVCRD